MAPYLFIELPLLLLLVSRKWREPYSEHAHHTTSKTVVVRE
jgi:hypothetical protein